MCVMAMGFGAALAALFLLRDFMLPVMRDVTYATTPSSVRQAAYALVPGGNPSAQALQLKTPTVFSRLSWRRLLEDGSPRIAFVGGLTKSMPPIEFWGAMMVTLTSGVGAGAQVGAARPSCSLSWHMRAPRFLSLATRHRRRRRKPFAMRPHNWLRAHCRPIFVCILGAVGLFMVTNGVGRI
jgi:Sap, sulfolipid-1-addressing protein